MDSPRTSLSCATQPASSTGRQAKDAPAHRRAQNWPSPVWKLTRYTGTVAAFVVVRLTARKNSFQAKMKQIRAVAANPGVITGTITERSGRRDDGPSTRAASRISTGISSRNDLSIHTAIGKFIAV